MSLTYRIKLSELMVFELVSNVVLKGNCQMKSKLLLIVAAWLGSDFLNLVRFYALVRCNKYSFGGDARVSTAAKFIVFISRPYLIKACRIPLAVTFRGLMSRACAVVTMIKSSSSIRIVYWPPPPCAEVLK